MSWCCTKRACQKQLAKYQTRPQVQCKSANTAREKHQRPKEPLRREQKHGAEREDDESTHESEPAPLALLHSPTCERETAAATMSAVT